MTKTFTFHENSSALNTFSNQKIVTKPIDTIRKSQFDFAQQSSKYDYYKDDKGTVWVVSFFGKSMDDAEWKLWITHQTPSTATDARYMAENLSKSEAIELFETIVGRTHDEIIGGFAKALKLPKMIKSSYVEKTRKIGSKDKKKRKMSMKDTLNDRIFLTKKQEKEGYVNKRPNYEEIKEKPRKEMTRAQYHKFLYGSGETGESYPHDFNKSFKAPKLTYNRQKIRRESEMVKPTIKKEGRDKKDIQEVQTTIKEGVIYDFEKSRKKGAKDKQKRKQKEKPYAPKDKKVLKKWGDPTGRLNESPTQMKNRLGGRK